MATTKISMTLSRPAAKQGGDRYEAKVKGEKKPWAVYFPQKISRKNGEPVETITLTIKTD